MFFKYSYVTDSTAGMIVALSLFLFPSKPPGFICGYGNEGKPIYKQYRYLKGIFRDLTIQYSLQYLY